MNRTKKFLLNSSTAAIMQLITMLVGFIIPKIMLTAYGSEINGLVSSITQFISYFNLVEAGLSGAAIYALYKPLADKDYKAVNGVISAAKNFYTQSGVIFVALTIGLACIYPFYIKTDALPLMDVAFLVLILGVSGALEFFTLSKYRVLLSADQKTYIISIASIIHIIVNTIIIVILSYYKVNVVVLRLIALLSVFLRSIILMVYCKKNYPYLNYKELPNKQALDKRWDALFTQILGAVHTGAPVILLTLILKDLKLVSIYTIYNMVIGGIGGILGIFISGLSASFGDVISRGETNILQKAYKEFEFMYYTLITIIYSVTFMTIMPFVKIYTSNIKDINYDLPVIGFLFVLNGFLYNIKNPQGMLVISSGMYKETRWRVVIQGAIAVIGGAVLAPTMGMAGILIGSILSNLYRVIDLMIFVPKYITKLSVGGTLVRMIRVIISIMSVCLFFASINNIQISNFLSWILYAIVIGGVSTIMVIIMGLVFERQEMKNLLIRTKSILKKK